VTWDRKNNDHVRVKRPPEERFFEKVEWGEQRHDGTRCLEWVGFRDKGYGRFQLAHQKPVGAHRWLYERWVGPIPEGMHIDHLCRNRACVNPAHLDVVTLAENNRRAAPHRERPIKWVCKWGHPKKLYPCGVVACPTCNRERARARYQKSRGDVA
jgi:hypothetical protein